MSGKEDLLPEVSDLDLNLDDTSQPQADETKVQNENPTSTQPLQQPTNDNGLGQTENTQSEPLSETKLMHDRIDELSKALVEEKKKSQVLNNQLAITRQQAMAQQMQERNPPKIPSKRSAKGFIQEHKQVLIIVVILLVVALIAALLVNKTSMLKKSSNVDENANSTDEKE